MGVVLLIILILGILYLLLDTRESCYYGGYQPKRPKFKMSGTKYYEQNKPKKKRHKIKYTLNR